MVNSKRLTNHTVEENGNRAALVRPGAIPIEIARHIDPSQIQALIDRINKQLATHLPPNSRRCRKGENNFCILTLNLKPLSEMQSAVLNCVVYAYLVLESTAGHTKMIIAIPFFS